MRCIALAEELASRGLRPVFFAAVDELPWVRVQLDRRGFETVTSPVDRDVVLARRPAAVVLDSYLLPPEFSAGCMAAGLPVLAIVDGDLAGHSADLYVDQNLGADDVRLDVPEGATRLAGLPYAMLRDDVVSARPQRPVAASGAGVPGLLAFFGGTDAYGAAPVLARTLVATGQPFTATVVAATPELAAEIRALPLADGQRITAIAPTDGLAGHVVDADLVLAAAGTSLWELLCLGAAAAVVRVADNQLVGYGRTVATGAVAGLGPLDELRTDPSCAVARLTRLLTAPEERAALRAQAWALVDGRGRARVADALQQLTSARLVASEDR